jgi:PLP dependent protein
MNGALNMGLAENLARVEEQIQAACRRAGRPRSEIALMAVTKTHAVPAILEAAALGISLFGENRVQEFQEKSAELSRLGYGPEWASVSGEQGLRQQKTQLSFHLIGHLQSNKALRAAELFCAVDTLDSLRLALRLNDAAERLGRRMPVLIEIKLGHEEAKTGLDPESPGLRELLERLPDLNALEPCGLMTVPPYTDDPASARPYFRQLRTLRDRLAAEYSRLSLAELSMGMSHDFAVAIEEGATQIRVGTALFGPRAGVKAPSA